ncbi:unnamed protein product [Clonostachys rosea]|uniref:Uncharacterized protein n=1 Tax=Bionectria ochroleuca TaxID=29856 RepID=A0ABY6UNH7_BIOOC|nr:unnamed protein product [Clonostachys rosea]
MDFPWRHLPGDESLVAIPLLRTMLRFRALASCMSCRISEDQVPGSRSWLLTLLAEIVNYILTFLDLLDPFFKVCITKNISLLWELFEDVCLCPPGLTPPLPSIGLKSNNKRDKNECWTQVIADDPEMEKVGNAVRALNDSRREEIFGPYRERKY